MGGFELLNSGDRDPQAAADPERWHPALSEPASRSLGVDLEPIR